ncbi:MAG TPA: cation transporter [Gemmatimonadales bacterium]
MERLKLDIGGMSCGHCVNAVMKALSEVPGVTVEKVEIGSAEVVYEPSQVTEQSILDAVSDEGYEATRAA